jgi:hypothetical protein
LKAEKQAEMEQQMEMLQREQTIKKTGSEDGGGKEAPAAPKKESK